MCSTATPSRLRRSHFRAMTIVSGSIDDSVLVWDGSTGEVLDVLEGHTEWVSSAAFSSDGKRIVSGLYDRSVRVWDGSMGEVLNVLEAHAKLVTSVAFSSESQVDGLSLSRAMNQCYSWPTLGRRLVSTGFHTHAGWLLSPAGEGYLMFVPLDALLPDFANILTMPRSQVSYVDFTGADLGPR